MALPFVMIWRIFIFSFLFVILFSLCITSKKKIVFYFKNIIVEEEKHLCIMNSRGILFSNPLYIFYKKSTLQEWKVTMRNMPPSNFTKTILWSLNGKAQKNGEVLWSYLLSLVKKSHVSSILWYLAHLMQYPWGWPWSFF